MPTPLSAVLNPRATRRNILLLLALFLAFNTTILPLAGARLEALSGGIGPLDLAFSYSPVEAYARLAAYGDEGRVFYAFTEISLDIVYPIVTALFLSLSLAYCFQRIGLTGRVAQRALVIPFLTLAADFAENAGIVTLLLTYPQQLPTVAALTSLFTSAKWILAVVSLVLLFASLAAMIGRRLEARRRANTVSPAARPVPPDIQERR